MSEEDTDALESKEEHRLIGLHSGVRDEFSINGNWVYYDLGEIAEHALLALQRSVLAIEQIVTGERLVNSLDIGDFYEALGKILTVENGQGVLSESGEMHSLQDEIQGIIDIVKKARNIAERPDEEGQ